MVENEDFQTFPHMLEALLHRQGTETKAKVMAAVVKTDRITSTCDAWTSFTTRSDLTKITEEWQLKSHILQTQIMTESIDVCFINESLSPES